MTKNCLKVDAHFHAIDAGGKWSILKIEKLPGEKRWVKIARPSAHEVVEALRR